MLCQPGRLIVLSVLLMIAPRAQATPIVDDVSTGPAKWTDPIKVYIPLDPAANAPANPRNRQDQVKAAVDAWKAGLDPKINLPEISTVMLDKNGHDPSTGKAPDPAVDGTVIVEWTKPPAKAGHAKPVYGGEDSDKKGKDGKFLLKNQVVSTVKIQIDGGVTALEQRDKDLAFATMLHEFGHALQIDHSREKDSVMQTYVDLYSEKKSPGLSDYRELNSLYVAYGGRVDGSVIQLDTGMWAYSYTANWLSGGEIPLFQIVTAGAPVDHVAVPDGWELVDFPGISDPNILSFRVAPTDLLQAYLNEFNPSITVSFETPWAPGNATAWIGTDYAIMGPQRVPDTGVALPFALALLGLCASRHFIPHRSGSDRS